MLNIFGPPEVAPDTRPQKATWMELFYDLAFVIAIAVVAHDFAKHISWRGFIDFLLFFIPLIFSWGKYTFYAGRFNTDDPVHRFLMLVQMTGVAAMGIAAHHGFEKGVYGFAVGYVVTQLPLYFVLGRAWWHYPEKRPLNLAYLLGGLPTTTLWVVVYFVPEHAYALVGTAVAVDLIAPIIASRFGHLHPLNEHHFPERFGLFSIIVLGEIVAATVRGGTHVKMDWGLLGTGFVSLVVAFGLWWLYFENVRGTDVQQKAGRIEMWAYTHIPWVTGVVLLGIGIEMCITEETLSLSQLRVVFWSAAEALACLGLLQWIIPSATTKQAIPRVVVAVLAMLAGFWPPFTDGFHVLAALAVGVVAIIAADWAFKRRARAS